MATDRRAGITTMAMGLGTKASAWLFGAEMVFPFIWVAVLSMVGVLPIYTVVIFMTLPVAIGNARVMMKSLTAGVEMIADLDVKTANLQMLFSILLTLSLAVAKFL